MKQARGRQHLNAPQAMHVEVENYTGKLTDRDRHCPSVPQSCGGLVREIYVRG